MLRSDRLSLRRFAVAGVVFLIPLLVLAGFCESRARAITTSYRVKRQGLEAAAPALEALVLGTSTALVGVQPRFFRVPAYNAANVSQSVYYDHEFLAKYLPMMPNLKVVVLIVDHHGLEYRFPDSPETWRQFLYFREFGFAPEGATDAYDVRLHSALEQFTPETRVRCSLEPCDLSEGIDGTGWTAALAGYYEGVDAGPVRVASDETVMHPENIPGNFALRLDDVEALERRGVAAAFVVPPVTRSYAAAAHPDVRARIDASLRELGALPGVMVRDYFRDPRFSNADFADSVHLNVHGSEKFSRLIDDEVVGAVVSRAAENGEAAVQRR
jgi:hypothetical protein